MLSLPTVPYEASAKAQDDLKVYAPWHTTSPRPCLLLQVSLSQHRMCPTKTTSEPDRECVCFVNIRLFRPRQIPVDIHVPGLILRGRLYPRSFETIYSGIQSQHVQDRQRAEEHFASTSCRPCLTCCATYSISTTEYGSTMRNRFCSSSVSYSAARCERIVGSDESSSR